MVVAPAPSNKSGFFAGANRRAATARALQMRRGTSAVAAGAGSASPQPQQTKQQQQRNRPLASPAAAAAAATDAAAPSQSRPLTTVTVDLGDRTYPIYIGSSLLTEQPELLRKHIPGKRVLIVTNDRVAPLYLEKVVRALEASSPSCPAKRVDSVVLPDGEAHKTLADLQLVWDAALKLRLDRGVTFVALGGGVVGDMAGFAASCYQRGVEFVQVPTTVMSQVDSSVGGKTGVNHPLGKNMIGAFYQPRCVVVDTDTLDTLPMRELASGISEIVKYGLIRDAALFEWLESGPVVGSGGGANGAQQKYAGGVEALLARDPAAVAYAVERSCVNKAEVVAADEREGAAGLRATLNLGHTFGHAIETATGYGSLLHGEAVSIGMVMAADMSARLGWIDQKLVERTRALLERAKLPIVPPSGMTASVFRELMAVDKKVADGKLRLVLLKGELGGCVVTGDFDPAKLDETLEAFCGK